MTASGKCQSCGMPLKADPKRGGTDSTFLLGFSEQSAFTRAFKRWSGRAPTEYREEARQ